VLVLAKAAVLFGLTRADALVPKLKTAVRTHVTAAKGAKKVKRLWARAAALPPDCWFLRIVFPSVLGRGPGK
jgi:hypothetical protein